MGQSPLLHKTHLLERGLSLIWSLMGQSHSVAQDSFTGDGPLLDPESHGSVLSVAQGFICWRRLDSIIALSCNQPNTPAGQQTAKHDGLCSLLSLANRAFVERFKQRDDPCRVGFHASLSLLPSDSINESYIQLSNLANLAILSLTCS